MKIETAAAISDRRAVVGIRSLSARFVTAVGAGGTLPTGVIPAWSET
jgi:hypothetical protein